MFDISAGEFLVVGAIALVVIGPKELPGVLRSVGQTVGKLKRMAGEFRQQFDDAMREADLHEAQKSVQDTVNSATSFNPINTIRNEIRSTVDEMKGATRSAEAAAMAPVEQGPPVSVMDPVIETPPVVSLPVEPVIEPEPPAAPPAKPKRARKPKGGDAA
ncbi:MAG: Sec-independent protein translocase protein TatB [Proteobacteria bacterium]|nr:Sec-independent protein translocase protein TatB [Pseudomonadota bacterium]